MATAQRTKAPAAAATKTNGGSTAVAGSTTIPPGAIAQRAYEIWQDSGRPNGRDQEHWFRAERELRAKQPVR